MRRSLTAIIVPALAVVLFCSGAAAQKSPVGQGRLILSGSICLASSGGDLYEDYGGQSRTDILLNPSLGYFLANSLALGAAFNYSQSSQGRDSHTSWGIGPQATYYFVTDREKDPGRGMFYPYLGLSFLYSGYTLSHTGDQERTDHLATLSFYGGGNYMITNSVGLFGQLQYALDSYKPAESNESIKGHVVRLFTGFTIFVY